MSFDLKTEKGEWEISRAFCAYCGGPTWVGIRKDPYHFIEADTLGHLTIKIDQFENPRECP